MQYTAKDLAEFIRPLAFLVGVTGFVVVFSSLRALRRRMQDGPVVITSVICALIGVSMIGLAIYMVTVSSNLPAK
ncbi:MAG TPA: hypothetical protein VGM54_02045 [Chthoniobacter sp.]|jgi:hypothetical protein